MLDTEVTYADEYEGNDESIAEGIASLVSDKTPAIAFTHGLFKAKPYLFGSYTPSLFYAHYAGTSYKPRAIFAAFENYVGNKNEELMKSLQTRQVGPFEFNSNMIVDWAKAMQISKAHVSFEPVMTTLYSVMKDWLANRVVMYEGINYNISEFKPLMYTCSGESFMSLLPYICYVITFMVHCHPYTFNEATSESSVFGFHTALNNWYMLNYTALGSDHSIDVINDSLEEIFNSVPDNELIDVIKIVLNPKKIINIRDKELSLTPDLLDECIGDQNGLNYATIKQAWNATMTRLLEITLELNPVKQLFDKFPAFDSSVVNIRELALWTQYALAGGSKSVIIENLESTVVKRLSIPYTMTAHADEASVKSYSTDVLDKQSLKTSIKQLSIAKGLAFSANDLVLDMAMSYIYKAINDKRNDPLDDSPPLTIDQSDFDGTFGGKSIGETLKNLFVNGLWMYDNSSMASIMETLLTYPRIASEITDILRLGDITQIVYKNRFASLMITTYVLSQFNTWVLAMCNNNLSVNYFSPYIYLANHSPETERVQKLADMTVSLMYLSTGNYCSFINGVAKRFSSLMEVSPIIQQPYVKGHQDLADIYAIGGCDLYSVAKSPNAFIRGYKWITSVYGGCEQLETFYRFAMMLDNTAHLELVESNIKNISVIETSLRTHWVKMLSNKSCPNILANYSFTSGNYTYKSYPYMLNLQTSDGKSILETVCSKAFAKSDAINESERVIIFKPIQYVANKVTAGRAVQNGMKYNNATTSAYLSETGVDLHVPVYSYDCCMEDVRVIYTGPEGRRLIQFNMFNSRVYDNQTILLYTANPVQSRFATYDTSDDLLSRL